MTITIYTKPGCPFCRAAKEDFDSRGIPFQEIDVYQEPAKAEAVFRQTGQKAVPIIVEDDKVTLGFGGY